MVEEIIYSRGQTQTFRDISVWATLPMQKVYALWAVNISNFRKAMTFFASASRGDNRPVSLIRDTLSDFIVL